MKNFPSWLKGLFVDLSVATLGGYPLAMLIGAPFVPLFFTIWAAFSFGRFWPRLNAVEVDENEVPVSPLLSALMRFNPSYKRRAPYSKVHETRPEYVREELLALAKMMKDVGEPDTRTAVALMHILGGVSNAIWDMKKFYHPFGTLVEYNVPDTDGNVFVKGAFRETIEKQNLEEFKKLREAKAVSGRLQELKEAGYLEQHHVDTMRNEIDESVEKQIQKSQSEAIDKAFEKLESLPPAPTLFLNEDDLKKAKKFSGVRREAAKTQFEAVLGHKDDKGNYLAPADANFQADLISKIPGIYEEIKNRPGTCLTDAEFEEHKNELKNQDAFRLMVEGVFYQLRVVCPAPSNCLFAGLVRNEAEETAKASAVDSILHLFQRTGEAMFGDDFNITYSWDEKKGETLIIKF